MNCRSVARPKLHTVSPLLDLAGFAPSSLFGDDPISTDSLAGKSSAANTNVAPCLASPPSYLPYLVLRSSDSVQFPRGCCDNQAQSKNDIILPAFLLSPPVLLPSFLFGFQNTQKRNYFRGASFPLCNAALVLATYDQPTSSKRPPSKGMGED